MTTADASLKLSRSSRVSRPVPTTWMNPTLASLPKPATEQATIHQTAAADDPIGAITPGLPPAWLLRVPIIIQSQWHGDLLLLRTQAKPPFTEIDASMMPAFANQAALMLENARLYRRAVRQAATDPITNSMHLLIPFLLDGGR